MCMRGTQCIVHGSDDQEDNRTSTVNRFLLGIAALCYMDMSCFGSAPPWFVLYRYRLHRFQNSSNVIRRSLLSRLFLEQIPSLFKTLIWKHIQNCSWKNLGSLTERLAVLGLGSQVLMHLWKRCIPGGWRRKTETYKIACQGELCIATLWRVASWQATDPVSGVFEWQSWGKKEYAPWIWSNEQICKHIHALNFNTHI